MAATPGGLRRHLPRRPGTRDEDWPLDDPAGQDIATVRRIRDEIRDRVRGLVAGLDATTDV